MRLTSWGKYPVIDTCVSIPRSDEDVVASFLEYRTGIGRGLGRSYGDSALNTTTVVESRRLSSMLAFDSETGVLVAESGVSLHEILDAFVPRGWFLPVTPGTKFVTLGGAVASDVHGKNHHTAGCFSQHVAWFDLWTPALGMVRCSSEEKADIFHATTGGQGLTGFITRVALRLVRIPSAFIHQNSIKAPTLESIMEVFEEQATVPFSVAWIDCLQAGKGLGRSIFMGGRFADPEELPAKQRPRPYAMPVPHAFSVPFDFPSPALNTFSVKAFNALYFGKAPGGHSIRTVSCNTFFYPLDAIYKWNRIYGKRGFTQYQLVIPKENATQGLRAILEEISKSGQGSFLAVLKLFGKQPCFPGNISFPMEGYTLALDFPIRKKLFPFLERLDAIVLDYGGRLYLTKDVRMSADVFAKGYMDTLPDFLAVKTRVDPDAVFSSLQSRRLKITLGQ